MCRGKVHTHTTNRGIVSQATEFEKNLVRAGSGNVKPKWQIQRGTCQDCGHASLVAIDPPSGDDGREERTYSVTCPKCKGPLLVNLPADECGESGDNRQPEHSVATHWWQKIVRPSSGRD